MERNPTALSNIQRKPERSPLLDRLGITAVVFDMDGVLIDSLPAHWESIRRIVEQEGLRVQPLDIYLREGMGTANVLRELSAERGWGLSDERVEEMALRRRALFFELYQHRVFPEVPRILAWLKQAGYALAVVSGAAQESMDRCLREYQVSAEAGALGQWFTVSVSGQTLARGKPFPDPYLKALEALGVEGRQALAVEDARAGIASAKAAGCRVAGLETTLPNPYLREADWVLPDHAALLRFLREGNSPSAGGG